MKITLLRNLTKFLIILISLILMFEIAYYGDESIKKDYNYVMEEGIEEKIKEKFKEREEVTEKKIEGLETKISELEAVPLENLEENEMVSTIDIEDDGLINSNAGDEIDSLLEVINKLEVELENDQNLYKLAAENLFLLKDSDEYIPGERTTINNLFQSGHISDALIDAIFYLALLSFIILSLFSIGIGSSIGALLSFILLYWKIIDFDNIPYLTNGKFPILNDGIPDGSGINLLQTIMIIIGIIIMGDLIEKIIKKRKDLIFSRLKMILPLGIIFLVSYSLAINTPSSNPTTVKFVENEGNILPENESEYESLTASEQQSWDESGKIIRNRNVINSDTIEWSGSDTSRMRLKKITDEKLPEGIKRNISFIKNKTNGDTVSYIQEDAIHYRVLGRDRKLLAGTVNWDHVKIVEKGVKPELKKLSKLEINIAKEVILENNKREEENMVGMGMWAFYILLSLSIILIFSTELFSTKLGRFISSKLEFNKAPANLKEGKENG